MLSHILRDSLLNLLHHLIYIHLCVCLTMLRVLALQIARVDIQAFLRGFHRVVLHTLLKSISSLFLVRLCVEVWLDHVIVRDRKFTLGDSILYVAATTCCLGRLCCHAPLLILLGCKGTPHPGERMPQAILPIALVV